MGITSGASSSSVNNMGMAGRSYSHMQQNKQQFIARDESFNSPAVTQYKNKDFQVASSNQARMQYNRYS